MTQSEPADIRQRIDAYLAQVRQLLGDDVNAAMAITHASQLTTVFYRLSRELSTLGALAWTTDIPLAGRAPATALPPDAGDVGPSDAPWDAEPDVAPVPAAAPAVDVTPFAAAAPLQAAAAAPAAVQAAPTAHAPAAVQAAPRAALDPNRLETLKLQMLGNQGRSSEQEAAKLQKARQDAKEILEKTLRVLGPTPSNLRGHRPAQREWNKLAELLSQELTLQFDRLEKPEQRELMCLIAARARALQDAPNWPPQPDCEEDMGRLIRQMSDCAKRSMCGMVHGLALAHVPKFGESWLDDARHWEQQFADTLARVAPTKGRAVESDVVESTHPDELLRRLRDRVAQTRELTGPDFIDAVREYVAAGGSLTHTSLVKMAREYVPDLYDVSGMADLRRAAEEALRSDTEQEPTSPLPEDWAGYQWTRGKRIMLIGGDPRPERVEPIRQAFDFADVEWVHISESSGTLRLGAAEEKLRNGRYDAVIVLSQYCSHTISDRMFELRREVPVVLSNAYGIGNLRMGIEKYMARYLRSVQEE